ncbi:unnamed protein product [Echinostoma caproni]|uniref:RNA-directed DNA polymerase from mobile element jockey n=1 Tax=Echinostoma caproni TaxID=27848 RepID=A0A183AG98_9TREM|nr:unnamed protein product [Echinostoma caproni]
MLPSTIGGSEYQGFLPKNPTQAKLVTGGNEFTSHPKELLYQKHLTYCYTNAQGFPSMSSELVLVLRSQSSQWDIIAVAETWLKDDILDSELCLPVMYLLRRHRPTLGGGVPLYHCDEVDSPVSAPDTI